jgi:hypothetical protein
MRNIRAIIAGTALASVAGLGLAACGSSGGSASGQDQAVTINPGQNFVRDAKAAWPESSSESDATIVAGGRSLCTYLTDGSSSGEVAGTLLSDAAPGTMTASQAVALVQAAINDLCPQNAGD